MTLGLWYLFRNTFQRGADLQAANEDGNTPFDIARESNVKDHILAAYKDQVVEREGNRAMHAILEAAEYGAAQPWWSRKKLPCRIKLPVGELTVDELLTPLQSFDSNLMLQADDTGALPFHIACRTVAPVQILDFLWDAPLEVPDVPANGNAFPIHFACQAKSPSLEVLDFLLDRDFSGRNLRERDSTGALPLHVLCESNPSLEALQVLLEEYHEAARTQDNEGALPLHRLCGAKPSVDAVKVLLEEYEGSISVKNKNGDSPFTVACKSRASPCVVWVLLRAKIRALWGTHSNH